jgi:DNA-binding MarR family transcriptional regulator
MTNSALMEFADKVIEISRDFMKYYAEEAYKVKLTLSQIAILDILSRNKESNMSDMARSTNVTTAAMTGIIDRLVRDGYVVRASDPNDRRVIKIRLSGKGRAAVKSSLENKKRIITKTFGVLQQRERDEYLKILTRIKEGLKI